MKISEQDILGCKKQHPSSQEKVYKALYVPMARVAYRYLLCMDLAQEIYNLVMFKVFERIVQFKGTADQFEPWVKRAIINAALDFIKTDKRRKKHESDSVNEQDHILDESTLEIQEFLISALQRIPKNQAQIFLLVAIDGYSHDEAAKRLGISKSNSKYLLHTARKNLQELLTIKKMAL